MQMPGGISHHHQPAVIAPRGEGVFDHLAHKLEDGLVTVAGSHDGRRVRGGGDQHLGAGVPAAARGS
jgi:hypothetical protein